MNKPVKYALASMASLLVIVGVTFLWPSGRHYISNRQQQNALNFYRQHLTKGMPREQVQAFIDGHQSQQSGQLFLQHPAYGSISIVLGEVPGPWYCSREVAYLQFNFNTPKKDSQGRAVPTSFDNFSDVGLGRELQDCL